LDGAGERIEDRVEKLFIGSRNILVLIAMLVIMPTSVLRIVNDSPDDQLKEAKRLRQLGRHGEALQIAQNVTKTNPNIADAWWVSGLAAHSLNQFSEALISLKETIRLAPRWAPCWAQYGVVLIENGQIEEGKKALFQAIKLDPKHVFSHQQLANHYQKQGDFEGQIFHLSRLDDLEIASSDDLNRLGIAYWKQKHFSKAIEYYLRSAKLGTGKYAYYNLALVYSHPEVSQDVDATDALRRALLIDPNYEPAIKKLNDLSPRLLKLAEDVLKHGETLLQLKECYQFYINPLEMIGIDREKVFDEIDTKQIQRLKTALLQEIELEDGVIQNLSGYAIDKSRAIGLCEQLFEPKTRKYHWMVLKNPFLLWFMTLGDIRLFLHSDSIFALQTLESLDDDGFRNWLSEPFAKQYDFVLTRAIERRAIQIVESLFDGRRWVIPEHDDICFTGAIRQLNRLLQPLKNAAENSKVNKPSLSEVQGILEKDSIVKILDLLPMHFRDLQTEAVQLIRGIAIDTYNIHKDSDLSKTILSLSKHFAFKSPELSHRLEEDFKSIENLIKEERKYEARLTIGKMPIEVTKDGVRKGDVFLSADSIISLRWGMTVKGYQGSPSMDFLMAFRDADFKEVVFSWETSSNLERQEELFKNLVESALNYIVPKVIIRVEEQLKRKELINVGRCVMKYDGVLIESKGWFSSKTHLIPWSQVSTKLEAGSLHVFDRNNPKINTVMLFRESENAIILQILLNKLKK
jgi:tetratricopeptide (TPR) repeat protein